MIATAASACDAAEINPSAATAKSQELDAVSAETAESAETYAPQLAIREQGSLSCNMPLSSWTYRINAYSFSGLSELLKLRSDGKNSLRGIVQRFKSIRRVGVFESPLERFKNWGTDLRMWGFLKPNEGDKQF